MPTLFSRKPSPNTATIINVLLQMKNNGLSDYTIKNNSKALRFLDNHTDLNNPEAVKTLIAGLRTSGSYKRNLAVAYNKYAQQNSLQWQMPRYEQDAKQTKIPTSEKLEQLIGFAAKTLATRLMMSMETGIRPIELCNLKVKDIDLERRILYPTTAKHGSARALKISQRLQMMIQDHIIRHNLNPNDQLFRGNAEMYGKLYRQTRNRLANKLKDPTIRTIKLYDFRHYYGTMLYHKTRDIVYTKQQLGHKKIETTMAYVQLLDINTDEWTCKTAQNQQEATQLIENGFEYVATTPNENLMLFRKRK